MKIISTVYPPNPPKDFNEWINYIHKELDKIKHHGN